MLIDSCPVLRLSAMFPTLDDSRWALRIAALVLTGIIQPNIKTIRRKRALHEQKSLTTLIRRSALHIRPRLSRQLCLRRRIKIRQTNDLCQIDLFCLILWLRPSRGGQDGGKRLRIDYAHARIWVEAVFDRPGRVEGLEYGRGVSACCAVDGGGSSWVA